jgi:hypothetical protein
MREGGSGDTDSRCGEKQADLEHGSLTDERRFTQFPV